MCEQWRESTQLREERLYLVFCCPWLLLSAGQHISLCWNQPSVVCVCVCGCVCVSPVNPQEVINALTLSPSLALFTSLSALQAITGFHCKPEQSYTLCTVEKVKAKPSVTYCRCVFETIFTQGRNSVYLYCKRVNGSCNVSRLEGV